MLDLDPQASNESDVMDRKRLHFNKHHLGFFIVATFIGVPIGYFMRAGMLPQLLHSVGEWIPYYALLITFVFGIGLLLQD